MAIEKLSPRPAAAAAWTSTGRCGQLLSSWALSSTGHHSTTKFRFIALARCLLGGARPDLFSSEVDALHVHVVLPARREEGPQSS